MMMDCIIRRKRLLTIILLTVFVALGARAQDDEDIAHSLNLTEVVVLAMVPSCRPSGSISISVSRWLRMWYSRTGR